ncbi:MAG: molybdopterin-dependent oxidoreductase [Burkholderiaceae bacterium]|nr:molybdopterin-dependent oxidoreductase [Burkholderiaceae bacterium]MDP1967803.1 molybdopterin-dependent oxidoreductase [Burkholderiaceae bacterium]
MKRRHWLLGSVGAAGSLVVGWSLLPPRARVGSPLAMPSASDAIAINGWIKIAADGSVVLAMARCEMGQGISTALPMLVAEELDVPVASVRLEQAGADTIYGNVAVVVAALPFHPSEIDGLAGQERPLKVRLGKWMVSKIARELGLNVTGSSTSVADAWPVLRLAAATARASLLGAASLQWRLPVAELTVRAGVISHPSGKSAPYATFAKFAASTPPGTVRLKDRKLWTLIGQPVPRLDLADKVNGAARFGSDLRLPDMLFASVRLCPMLGGAPGAIRSNRALAMHGVERVVPLPAYAGSTAGFAVVATNWWQANEGVKAVDVEWQERPRGSLDSARIERELRAAVESGGGAVFFDKGSVDAIERTAPGRLQAWYRAPYLPHLALEPMTCTARVRGALVEIWVPTQAPTLARAIAAQVAGVAAEQVVLHQTLPGGAFGRGLDVDVVAQAVRVAMDCAGRAVQLNWSRDEDTTHDFYRPMHVARLDAALDATGRAGSLRIVSAGDAIVPRWLERAMPALSYRIDLPDKTASEGLFDLPYEFAHQRMEHVATHSGVPVGFWRSVGHSHNAFFSECFIDELAYAAGQDALAYRRSLLTRVPRHLAVLELAAAKAGWGRALRAGRAQGLALHESFGTVVAQVVELSLEAGKPRVHRVVCAMDCGTVVNPQIVAQQVEGAVVFALSAAMYGGVDIRNGAVQQANFPRQELVRMADSPNVETWLVPSTRDPSGAGEPATPPVAPAVANALFRLTGRRIRKLPLTE